MMTVTKQRSVERTLSEMGFSDGDYDIQYVNGNVQYSAYREGVNKLGSARKRKFNKNGMGGKDVKRTVEAKSN